jgi:glycosyltransferase involved in cell wall biosynthesis
MDWRAACAAVIPCLNEEAAIGPLVGAVRRHLTTVFVIDDASRDDTSLRARDAGAVVVKHAATLGKGAALQSGWSLAREQGYRWVLMMDGDGQHCPDDIPAFFHCAERTAVSLVVGNRMGQASRMPLVRRWVNRWMSWQLSELSGRALPDSQCGFRLMHLQDWTRLPIFATHFEIESEVLYRFATAGLAIGFVPIQVIYKEEHSKIHPWTDTLRWLHWRRQARRNRSRGECQVAESADT